MLNMITITVRGIDPSLWHLFRVHAVSSDIPLGTALNRLLAIELERNQGLTHSPLLIFPSGDTHVRP